MPLMEDIRRFFRGKKKEHEPVALDLTGTQAEGLSSTSGRDGNAAGETDNGGAISRRPRSVAELRRRDDDVMDLVRKISEHLDTQTERTERMMTWMVRLPQALEALPEVSRQNARMLEIFSEHLGQIREREETLSRTLSRISESSQHQTEVLGLLQQQLDSNCRAADHMTETLGSFRETLATLAATSNRSTEILSEVMKANEDRESKLTAMFERTQRWMIIAAALVGALAIGAIVLSMLAILKA